MIGSRGALLLATSALVAGCATSVQRLGGELPAPGGQARTGCESAGWLTLIRTRSRVPGEDGRTTVARDDGVAAYRSGASDPEELGELGEEVGSTPTLDRHAGVLGRHQTDQWVGAGLGVGSLVALGIGSFLFATSFETKKNRRSDGSVSEEQEIKGGRAAAGGVLVGAGFGLGIAAIIVSPSSAERARADQQRYVYLPPEDDPAELAELVGRHNARVRAGCAKTGR